MIPRLMRVGMQLDTGCAAPCNVHVAVSHRSTISMLCRLLKSALRQVLEELTLLEPREAAVTPRS